MEDQHTASQRIMTSAEKAWANPVVREAIIGAAHRSTCIRLLSVSKESHVLAVEQVYADVQNVHRFELAMLGVTSAERHRLYHRAVRHIGQLGDYCGAIAFPEKLRHYPRLRSITTVVGTQVKFGNASATQHDRSHAIVTLGTRGSCDGFNWTSKPGDVKRFLPQEWIVSLRDRYRNIEAAADVDVWVAGGETSCIMPLHLQLTPLDGEELVKAASYMDEAGQCPGAEERRLTFVPPANDGHLITPDILARFARTVSHLELYGVLPLQDLRKLAHSLRRFRQVEICIPAHELVISQSAQSDTEYVNDSCKSHEGRLEKVVCKIAVGPGVTRAYTAWTMLQEVRKGRTWGATLARTLLASSGPLPRFTVKFVIRGGSASDFEDHMQRDNEHGYTHRINEIIDTMVNCRRDMRPAGWWKNDRQEGTP